MDYSDLIGRCELSPTLEFAVCRAKRGKPAIAVPGWDDWHSYRLVKDYTNAWTYCYMFRASTIAQANELMPRLLQVAVDANYLSQKRTLSNTGALTRWCIQVAEQRHEWSLPISAEENATDTGEDKTHAGYITLSNIFIESAWLLRHLQEQDTASPCTPI